MQAMLDAVRATGASNVVVLGGVQWANTIWSTSTDNWLRWRPVDPLNNLVASFHAYQNTWCRDVACYDREVAPVAAQVPVIAGEFGHTACDANFMNTLMNWMDARGLGYLAWTWNTWGASCGSIALVTSLDGTPTQLGQIYKSHLALLP